MSLGVENEISQIHCFFSFDYNFHDFNGHIKKSYFSFSKTLLIPYNYNSNS
jgi:hypothetical protein